MKGTIRRYNEQKGYGFLIDENRNSRFFHVSSLKRNAQVTIGANVEFTPIENEKGLAAREITIFNNYKQSKFVAFDNVRINVRNIKSYGISQQECPVTDFQGRIINFGNIDIELKNINYYKIEPRQLFFQKIYEVSEHEAIDFFKLLNWAFHGLIIQIDGTTAFELRKGNQLKLRYYKRTKTKFDDVNNNTELISTVYSSKKEKANPADLITVDENSLDITTNPNSEEYIFSTNGFYIITNPFARVKDTYLRIPYKCCDEICDYYNSFAISNYYDDNLPFDIDAKYKEIKNSLLNMVNYLYITTYQNENYKFINNEVTFNIYEKMQELDSLLNED